MAGLGMLGGESQYAAKNIGQGALMGMQQFTGAEQSRQKEGRALAMDMAQSGLKKSDIYTNLAKLGYEGKKAEALAEKAYAEARLEVPAKAQYYKDMGAAAGIRGAGTGVSQEAIRLDKYIDNESAKLKDFTIPKDERARIRANIDAAQRRLAELSGLSMPSGGSVAPTGGSLAPGKDGRFGYTPGG